MPGRVPLEYKRLRPISRKLRNNLTEAERKLWQHLRMDQLGNRFYRQKIIDKYIVDFYCSQAKLVVEVDGGQHYGDVKTISKDSQRDRHLTKMNLQVLRFSNTEVLQNIEGVLEAISTAVKARQSPNPLLRRGRKSLND